MKNSRGLSAIELVLYLGAATITAAVLLSLNTIIFKTEKNQSLFQDLQRTKNQIFRVLNDNRAWEQTLRNPANAVVFDCFLRKISCMSSSGVKAGGEFQLFDQSNQPVAVAGAPSTPSNGFDERGNFCNTYSPPPGNPNCPFRYILRWEPICDKPDSCIIYQMKVTATFVQAAVPAGKQPMNTEPYKLTMIKEDSGPSVQSLCDSFKSSPTDTTVYFDPATNTCVFTGGTCAPPLVLVGFQPNGAQMCGQFEPVRCPYNYYMTAMDRGDGSAPATLTCQSCDATLPPVSLSFGAIR